MTDPDPVAGLRPGLRVVVRHRVQQGVTDALGDVVAMDSDTISVRTRRGLEVIARTSVVAAKEVPPQPVRRGAPHLAISMDDLERVMVEGWPPLERAELGGWLLRAAAGFTGRANSALPLGSPGVPLSEAVDRAERWYHQRGLRPLFSLFGPAGFTVEDDRLGRELLGRDYQQLNRTVVLTSATRTLPTEIPAAKAGSARVLLESEPSPSWWDTSRYGDARATPAGEVEVPRSAVRAVLTGSPDQLFASLQAGGSVIAVARLAFAHRWAGVSGLHVAPEHRRTGVAEQLMGALADASRARGIRSLYLQVGEANSPARSLYGQLGFSTHHEYCYLSG